MNRIEQFEEAEEKGAFRFGGMISNLVWTTEEVREMIEKKALYLEETSFGKLWLLCQSHRNQLFYQIDRLQMDHIPSNCPFPMNNCVSEITFSDAQTARKNEDRTVLEKLGFSWRSSAVFLSRVKTETDPAEKKLACCRSAEPEDTNVIEALYEACFDRLTDAIPGKEELAESIRQGKVIVFCSENNKVIGTVMVQKYGRRRLIRHVAVASDWRKKGCGTILVKAAMDNMTSGEKAYLWVKEENTTAIHFYQNLGFEPTGRKMEIWVKK